MASQKEDAKNLIKDLQEKFDAQGREFADLKAEYEALKMMNPVGDQVALRWT